MTDAKQLVIDDGGLRSPSAADVVLVMDKLITTRLLIQANSGGGKSYAIRWLLEQTYGRIQHIVIDREGEFSTLRGIHPYLLVGRDGDVAADTHTAKLLARKILELNLSAVVDLSEMTPGQQREYVRVFIDALNHAPRALWKDCLIVIDEAHIFAPESGKGSSEATESIALLLSTGRKRGFCPVLATQRLAKLNKDVAAECLNKLIGRTSNEDVKRAGEELAQGKQSSIQLRGLDPGQFWAYGPAIAPEPMLVRTGKVKTAPPPRGAERGTPPAAPEEIRAALAKELAELPKQATDEAQSIEALNRRVRDLTRQVSQQPTPERVEVPVRDEGAIQEAVFNAEHRLRSQHGLALEDIRKRITDVVQPGLASAVQLIDHAQTANWPPGSTEPPAKTEWWEPMPVIDKALATQSVKYLRTQMAAPHMHTVPISRPRRDVELQPRDVSKSNGELPRGALKMLDVLSRYPNDALTPAQLGTLSGYAASGGTFGEYLRQLRKGGLVNATATGVTLTNAGVHKVGGWKEQQTSDEIFHHWCDVLPLGPAKMLAYLREQHPRSVTLERLGDVTGYTSTGGTFGEYLRQLKRVGLITSNAGMARLVDELAP
jgi:hypothetical protein